MKQKSICPLPPQISYIYSAEKTALAFGFFMLSQHFIFT